MPRNGSGLYTLPYNWNDDKANGIKVLSTRMQNQDQDIANALTGSLAADGQTSITGDLDFNANRAVDLADGQDTQDAVVIGQAQTGELQYYGVSSTVPLGTDGLNYEVNANPTLLAYEDGMSFNFVAHYTCVADPQLRVNTLGQKNLVKDDGAGGFKNLISGDILADHQYDCYCNSDVAAGKIIVKNPETKEANFNNLDVVDLNVSSTLAGAVFNPSIPTLSNNASDANNDIDFSVGSGFYSGANIKWSSDALTKRLDATWAAGTNQGGLFSGSKANSTWYHCFIIFNPTTKIADAGFSTSVTAADLPAGYTDYFLVESILTDGSGNIIQFNHYVNGFQSEMVWKTIRLDVNTPCTTTAVLQTLSVPVGRVVNANIVGFIPFASSAFTYGLITSPQQNDSAPSSTLFNILTNGQTAVYSDRSLFYGLVRTNTARQIRTRFVDTTSNILIWTNGWSK